jgi:hypothetical protein
MIYGAAVHISTQGALVLLFFFMLLLAVILAACIASFAHLFFGVPFWPAYRSALKSSGLLCALFFLIIVGIKYFVPQQAVPPAAGAVLQVPSPVGAHLSRKIAGGPENSR